MLTAALLMCAMHAAECRTLDAQHIASAIDDATDAPELRAVLVVYSYHESHWTVRPRAESWDARTGIARGPLQLWGEAGMLPLRDQCRAWLHNVQASSLAAVDSSPSRAYRRAAEARALLGE
jgi:hypothetical protein